MQTTLRIDDALYREAKAEAVRQGMTLSRFLEQALLFRIQKAKAGGERPPARFRVFRSRKPFPFDDRRIKEIANREQEKADVEKLMSSAS